MIFETPSFDHSDPDTPIVPEVSSELLVQLFAAAGEVLKVRPWKTLHDTDWFGIVDPDTGETHIVAVMGAANKFFAVQVYLPNEGIRFWNDVIHNGEPNVSQGTYQQRMLSCEFVSWNEEDLDETDMQRNEEHDPELSIDYLDSFLFRSTLPGCVNWHPTEEEVPKLLDALQLVPRFLKQWKKLPQKCYNAEFGDLMPWIPCYHLPKDKDRHKADHWEFSTVRFPEAEATDTYLPDELFPNRVSTFTVRAGAVWQVGSAYFGQAIIADGRPKWLALSLIAVEKSGIVLGGDLLPCCDALEVGLRKSFLKAVEEAKHLPETLRVGSPLAKRVFETIPGLKVIQADELPEWDQAVRHFMSMNDGFAEDHPANELSVEAMEKIQAIMASAPPLDQVTPEGIADLVARLAKVEGAEDFVQTLLEQLGQSEDSSWP